MRTRSSGDKPQRAEKSILDKLTCGATIVAAIGALFFGYLQYKINSELVSMNKTVAVTTVVEDRNSGELVVRNTGKLNLHLVGLTLGEGKDAARVFQHPRLIAANANGDPGYRIRLGKEEWKLISHSHSATLTFFLEDDIGRKWVSEQGYFKVNEEGLLRLCTYDTFGEDWRLRQPENRITSDSSTEFARGAYFVRGAQCTY